MNSQQELLDAINAISQDKNKSCDTPATVLRVDGNTVWVHIDGGADETPVQKTINCSEGETVQVRISNGSAFLVGNASAPPTDDKTANIAHFVAEGAARVAQIADEKAEEAQPAYVSYKVYYKLSDTRPDTPTDDTYVAEGWTENEPLWSSDDTRAMWYSIRTKEVSKAVVWSAPLELTSYANIQVLKNAILLEVGEGNVINSIQDSNGDNILDSNDEPIYGSIGDLQATNAKIVETAQNILLQVSREYLSTSDAAQTYATQTSLELTDEEIRSDVARTYVGKGNSGVQTLSSTMLQNVNGVNIYNDTLAVGDTYAHIDGDSFDIKKCTTAGQIDDANDGMYASFGREVTVGTRLAGSTVGQYSQVHGYEGIASGNYAYGEGYYPNVSGDYSHAEGAYGEVEGDYSHAEGFAHYITGNYSHAEGFENIISGNGSHVEGSSSQVSGDYSHAEGEGTMASGYCSHAQNKNTIADSEAQTAIGKYNISDANDTYALIIGNGTANARSDALRVKWDGSVIDGSGNKISPTILTSTTIPSSATIYQFDDASIKTNSVIDIYDSIFGFAPTGMMVSDGICAITFPAQSSSHQIKLFVY